MSGLAEGAAHPARPGRRRGTRRVDRLPRRRRAPRPASRPRPRTSWSSRGPGTTTCTTDPSTSTRPSNASRSSSTRPWLSRSHHQWRDRHRRAPEGDAPVPGEVSRGEEQDHALSEDDRRFAPSSAEPMAGEDSDEEERTVSWSTRRARRARWHDLERRAASIPRTPRSPTATAAGPASSSASTPIRPTPTSSPTGPRRYWTDLQPTSAGGADVSFLMEEGQERVTWRPTATTTPDSPASRIGTTPTTSSTSTRTSRRIGHEGRGGALGDARCAPAGSGSPRSRASRPP